MPGFFSRRRAVEDHPAQAAANLQRAMAYSHQGEFDLAIAESSRAVELDPTLALAFINRGHAYIQQGELDLAVANLTKAIDLDPTLKSGFHNRGIAYLQQGHLDLAVADLTKAIELHPDFAFAYLDRAKALLEQGDHRAARADAEAAIELNPDLTPGYYAIVDSLQALADSAPLPFTLDLPDGWVGGRLPDGYRQALLDYGRVHPECAERVTALPSLSVWTRRAETVSRTIEWIPAVRPFFERQRECPQGDSNP